MALDVTTLCTETTRARSAAKSVRKAAVSASLFGVAFLATTAAFTGDAPQAKAFPFLENVSSDEPQLPSPSEPIAPLRRGKDNKIEVITPNGEPGKKVEHCSHAAICVGQGEAISTLSAALTVARDGDVIEVIGGIYHEAAKIVRANLTVRGIAGRPHFDCHGLTAEYGKSCFLLAADGIVLENLEISDARGSDANDSCIGNEPDKSFTLRRVFCHGSDLGIRSGGGRIVIENSEFFENQTHNAYFSGSCVVTVRGSVFRDAVSGDEFLSRCTETQIFDSTFRSTRGARDIDIPDGGETTIYRSTVIKFRGTRNEAILSFTRETCAHPGRMLLKEVRIINSSSAATVQNFDRCTGGPIVLRNVVFEGIHPKLIGYVLME